MSFRLRLTLLSALAVAVSIVGTSFAVYYTDRSQLIREVDSELTAARGVFLPGGTRVVSEGVVRNVPALGKRRIVLPNTQKAVNVRVAPAGGPLGLALPKTAQFKSTTIRGIHTRVLGFQVAGRTVLVSTSLVDVDSNLSHLRELLILISLAGIGAAAVLGALVSSRAVAPLRRLTETAERIVRTGDLSERIGQSGRDEVSRLSAQLDELLATLDLSLRTQRQLVADASHELRTPLASLRANVELLADPSGLEASERGELTADVHEELEAMTMLVEELVELARGEEQELVPRELRLDEVVRAAVDRSAKRAPTLEFRTRLEPSVVTGVPERIERAVTNLLDNARKWSPAGGTVDVDVHDGVVEVRDAGPGIDEEDAPLVFNRFYRSAHARGMPGAGLGLAIVKQIADAHGGSVTVDRAPGGGALLRLHFHRVVSGVS